MNLPRPLVVLPDTAPKTHSDGGNWPASAHAWPFLFQSSGQGLLPNLTPARAAQKVALLDRSKPLSPLLCAIYEFLTIRNSCEPVSENSVHGIIARTA